MGCLALLPLPQHPSQLLLQALDVLLQRALHNCLSCRLLLMPADQLGNLERHKGQGGMDDCLSCRLLLVQADQLGNLERHKGQGGMERGQADSLTGL